MALAGSEKEGPQSDFGFTKVALSGACGVGEESKATEGRPCLLHPSTRPEPGSCRHSVNEGRRQGARRVGVRNLQEEGVWGRKECLIVTLQKQD